MTRWLCMALLVMGGLSNGMARAAGTIEGLSGYAAAPGDTVAIHGTGFGAEAGKVSLAGLRVTTVTWGESEITFTVPADGCSGLLSLRDAGGAAMNAVRFIVRRALPDGQFAPANLRLMDTGLPGAAFLMETDSAYLYGVSGFEMLNTFRINAAAPPTLVSRFNLPQRVGDLRLFNGYLFISGDHGLMVFRCSDLQRITTESAGAQSAPIQPVAACFPGACLAVDVRANPAATTEGALVALCEYRTRSGSDAIHAPLYAFAGEELIALGAYSRAVAAAERQHAIAIDPMNPKVYVSGFQTLFGNDKYLLELDVSNPTSPILNHREETSAVLAFDMDARGDRLWTGVSNTGTILFQSWTLKAGAEHLAKGPAILGAWGIGRTTRVRVVDDDVTVGTSWSGARPDVFLFDTFGFGTSALASTSSLDWAFDVSGYATGAGTGRLLVADEWGGFITYNYQRPTGYTLSRAPDYRFAVATAMTEGIHLTADRIYAANRGAGIWSADRFHLSNAAGWRSTPFDWTLAEPQPYPISAVGTRRDPARGVLIAALAHEKAMAWGERVYGQLYQETSASIELLAQSEEIDPPGLGSSGVDLVWPAPDLVFMVTGTDGFRAFVVNPDAPSIRLHKDCRSKGFATDVFSTTNTALCMGGCELNSQYKLVVGSQPGLLIGAPTLNLFNVSYPEGVPDRWNPDRPIVVAQDGALQCSAYKTVSHLRVSASGLIAIGSAQGAAVLHPDWLPSLNGLLAFQAWNQIRIPTAVFQPWWSSAWTADIHDVSFTGDQTLYMVKAPEGVWQMRLSIDWANRTPHCAALGYYPGVECGMNYSEFLAGWGNPDIVTLHFPYGLASDGAGLFVTGWNGKVQRLQFSPAINADCWILR